MVKVKVIMQNNKEFIVDVESFDGKTLLQEINKPDNTLIAIGNLIVNKYHIECIHEDNSQLV